MEIDIKAFIDPEHSDMFPLRVDFDWSTDVVSTGRNSQRNQLFSQPVRHWFINFNALKQAGRDKLIEIFNRAAGSYRTFLLKDREDYECSLSECSVTAAGGETTTQLIKTYYPGESEAWSENKKKIVPGSTFPPVVKIDAATKTEGTDFTLDDTTGIIDWSSGSAPNGPLSAGEVVTASYQFYFQVRFASDTHSDIKFHPSLWRAAGVHLVEESNA
jgi:uncharacterized protein (TIGR02217 family)